MASAWVLQAADIEKSFVAQPDNNIYPAQVEEFVHHVVDGFDFISPTLDTLVSQRAETFLEVHRQARTASKTRGVR